MCLILPCIQNNTCLNCCASYTCQAFKQSVPCFMPLTSQSSRTLPHECYNHTTMLSVGAIKAQTHHRLSPQHVNFTVISVHTQHLCAHMKGGEKSLATQPPKQPTAKIPFSMQLGTAAERCCVFDAWELFQTSHASQHDTIPYSAQLADGCRKHMSMSIPLLHNSGQQSGPKFGPQSGPLSVPTVVPSGLCPTHPANTPAYI